MAWTEITRLHYRREGLRYASDATDAEWSLIEPFMPVANSIGRPRKTNIREVVNALFYIASTGCQWRQLPKEGLLQIEWVIFVILRAIPVCDGDSIADW